MTHHRHHHPSAFSLIEVLLAVMILGIGLIMVATVFPVAANWTRQSTEDSLAQSIAQSALTIIKGHYAQNGQDLIANSSLQSGTVELLPGLDSISLNERAYQFGSSTPFPAPEPANCTYFWSALAKLSPNQPPSGRSIDIYILVFHKGALDQTFTDPSPDPPFVPHLTLQPLTPSNPLPRVGEFGIAHQSGTVFRQIVGPTPRPALSSADSEIWIAPPADGTSASPLVYIFQTTLSY